MNVCFDCNKDVSLEYRLDHARREYGFACDLVIEALEELDFGLAKELVSNAEDVADELELEKLIDQYDARESANELRCIESKERRYGVI